MHILRDHHRYADPAAANQSSSFTRTAARMREYFNWSIGSALSRVNSPCCVRTSSLTCATVPRRRPMSRTSARMYVPLLHAISIAAPCQGDGRTGGSGGADQCLPRSTCGGANARHCASKIHIDRGRSSALTFAPRRAKSDTRTPCRFNAQKAGGICICGPRTAARAACTLDRLTCSASPNGAISASTASMARSVEDRLAARMEPQEGRGVSGIAAVAYQTALPRCVRRSRRPCRWPGRGPCAPNSAGPPSRCHRC